MRLVSSASRAVCSARNASARNFSTSDFVGTDAGNGGGLLPNAPGDNNEEGSLPGTGPPIPTPLNWLGCGSGMPTKSVPFVGGELSSLLGSCTCSAPKDEVGYGAGAGGLKPCSGGRAEDSGPGIGSVVVGNGAARGAPCAGGTGARAGPPKPNKSASNEFAAALAASAFCSDAFMFALAPSTSLFAASKVFFVVCVSVMRS